MEQTRRIHERQRLARTVSGIQLRAQTEAIRRRHHNAQRLLRSVYVVTPWVGLLTFPNHWPRTRRDHERLQSLSRRTGTNSPVFCYSSPMARSGKTLCSCTMKGDSSTAYEREWLRLDTAGEPGTKPIGGRCLGRRAAAPRAAIASYGK
ncbi:MAG: hypothetical protein ACYCW6_24105 [Candidatus Xenobia bacterium]